MNGSFSILPNQVQKYLVCFLEPREILTCSLVSKNTKNVVDLIFKNIRSIAEKQCPYAWNELENAGLSEKFISYNFLSAHSQTESIHNIFDKISIEKIFLTAQIWSDILTIVKDNEEIEEEKKFKKNKKPLINWPRTKKDWWKLSFFCTKNGNSIKERKMNIYNTCKSISLPNLSCCKQITLANKISENIFFIKKLNLNYTGDEVDRKAYSVLPENIELFDQLEDINLKNRRFKYFPKELCKLNYIDLNVSSCGMETISEDIVFPKGLKIIDLSHNNLTQFPDSLKLCENLRHLYIHKNKFDQEVIEKFFFQEGGFVFKNLCFLKLSLPEKRDSEQFKELLMKIRIKVKRVIIK